MGDPSLGQGGHVLAEGSASATAEADAQVARNVEVEILCAADFRAIRQGTFHDCTPQEDDTDLHEDQDKAAKACYIVR